MFEETESWKLWTNGLEHWREGRLNEASSKLQEAIAKADPSEFALPEYQSSFGRVLAELGKATEAESAFEAALELSLRQSQDNASPPVVVARYFLAEHLIHCGRPSEALQTTEPSLGINARVEGLLRCVRALAFFDLGEPANARDEARLALQLATSDEQRAKFTANLTHVLESAV